MSLDRRSSSLPMTIADKYINVEQNFNFKLVKKFKNTLDFPPDEISSYALETRSTYTYQLSYTVIAQNLLTML